MLLFSTILISFFITFMMIVTVPILFKSYDSHIENIWLKLDSLTEEKNKIRQYSLSVIKYVYEENHVPSKKKILIVSIILNSLYGVIMYGKVGVPSFLPNQMFYIGLAFFIIGGSFIMTTFEYYAFKININSIHQYIRTNDIKYIILGLKQIFYRMYLIPFLIAIFSMLINPILGFFGVYILYFSPLGILFFMLNIFETALGDDRYLLLLSSISIFAPLIFFFLIDYFYLIIRKMILPIIEGLEKCAKYIQKNENTFNCKQIIWCCIFLMTILPILAVLS